MKILSFSLGAAFAAFVVLSIFAASPAYAFGDQDHTCQGSHNCNETNFNYNDDSVTNKAYGGDGGYAKAYGGKGEANVGNGIGNLSPKANADAYSTSGAAALGKYDNTVTIQDNSVRTYEEKYQAPSMVAPGIDTSQVNVECPLFVQDGWSGSLSGPGAGGSVGATDAEAIPTCFALLAAKNSTGDAKIAANTAFYCLSFEAAGVDNAQCDGWRDVVRGGPAPTVRDVEVREGR
jgi:hypothetical protein